MNASVNKTKTLHYKRAVLIGASSGSLTLASYLDAALSATKTPLARQERLGESSDNVRILNKCHTMGTLICGRFLDFTEGGFQAVLELDPDADDLKIRHLPPGKEEQFLEGILTFGVRGNHVLLVQSKGLRVAHLEQHLNWLLRDHTQVMPAEVRVVLEDAPRQDVQDKLSDVDWIELRTPVPVSTFTGEPEQIPHGFGGGILRHLREWSPSVGTFFERLSGQAALAVDDVEMTLTIKRRGRRSRQRHSMLDEIAHNLRTVDDVEFTLKTKHGTYSAGELKLRVDRSFPVEPGTTMPDLAGAAVVMQSVLADLITQRRIEE